MQERRQTRTNRPYELYEYDDSWPERFEDLKNFLDDIFGDEAVAIEHVGSTSIPGMLAKPIVDAVVAVKDLKLVRNHYDDFLCRGYECKGNFTGQDEEYFTYTNKEGKRIYNVHVMQEDNTHIVEVLNFRDFMRSDPSATQEYRDIKLKLKDAFGTNDYNSYDTQKGVLMERLKVRAREWAKENSHQNY